MAENSQIAPNQAWNPPHMIWIEEDWRFKPRRITPLFFTTFPICIIIKGWTVFVKIWTSKKILSYSALGAALSYIILKGNLDKETQNIFFFSLDIHCLGIIGKSYAKTVRVRSFKSLVFALDTENKMPMCLQDLLSTCHVASPWLSATSSESSSEPFKILPCLSSLYQLQAMNA